MNAQRWMDGAQSALFIVGFVLLAVWFKGQSDTAAFQRRESRALDAAIGRAGAQDAVVRGSESRVRARNASSRTRRVIGRIEIPRLGISAMIGQGIEPRILELAVGHVETTAQPGEPGNVGLAGHRDSFFRGLGNIRERDVIRIVTARGTFRYRVQWGAVVEPGRVDVFDSTATPSVTLVTCYPFDAIGPSPQRFVVRATQIDPNAAAVAVATPLARAEFQRRPS
ncbi:MAG: class D sortase [Candidatus Eisenbacteria bacterium]|uniref:Class D sortase n=1 Tax=Eiseniibacteriota bacterium TaxID=2212470 RepID=A0A849SNE4_UNCEI|nr:class D sortase [Candidatus Eisenbacteria bacterium]